MKRLAKASLRTAVQLLLFAIVGTALLALTYELTRGPILQSEEHEKMKLISQIAPADSYDHDIMQDTQLLAPDELLGNREPVISYRGDLQNTPNIVILNAIAPDGYNGKINLIIAIRHDGSLSGVRVVSHSETPGLGDYIEIAKNNWITTFNNRSLNNPDSNNWKVKKDGGVFDSMAGATITPRAVVKAVHKALQYYAQHRKELLAPRAAANSKEQKK
ncbi:MAG: electron transport complex subunit RsxG [Pseudomonadota bacterium]